MSCLETSMPIKHSIYRTCFALLELFMECDLKKNLILEFQIYIKNFEFSQIFKFTDIKKSKTYPIFLFVHNVGTTSYACSKV